MKTLFATLALILTLPIASQAENLCGTGPHALDAVSQRFSVDPGDSSARVTRSDDEYFGGGEYIFRKITVRIQSAHNNSSRDIVVSYSIVKSFDGPAAGDYCDLTAVEHKSDVCSRQPKLDLCQ